MTRTFVCFDTETATARGAQHLLEIGAVRVEDGEAVDTFSSLVRPEVPIDPDVRAVHGIGDEDVRDADDARAVLERFVRWIEAAGGDVVLAAHNASFDAGVLGFEAARHGLALPERSLVCTVKLARHYVPDATDHRLDTLCAHLDVELVEHHRALPDAVACWKVLEACWQRARGDDESSDPWGELLARGSSRVALAQARPREPRFAVRLRALESALREKRVVNVHYGIEGAVARLSILPRLAWQTREHSYVEAECQRSGLLKTYRLDRVLRVED